MCKGTSIRPFDEVVPRLRSTKEKPNFDGIALSCLREKLDNGELAQGRQADALVSQHSEQDPVFQPMGKVL